MTKVLFLLLLVIFFCIFRPHKKRSLTEGFDGPILTKGIFWGDINNTEDVKIWLRHSLHPELSLVEVAEISPVLATIFWVVVNKEYRSSEFNVTVRPFIVNWKMNDAATAFRVDSVQPYVYINTLPFIKNQNEMYARLFEVRMAYLRNLGEKR